MSSLLSIALGILTAMGGFVDIGELVFSVQAGVKFGYALLWAVAVGTIGIILFSESSGRVAAVTGKAVFTILKDRLPEKLAFFVLIASSLLNVVTCAAEIGGVGIALQLLTGLSPTPCYLLTALFLFIVIWFLPFSYLERTFGLLGLFMIIFIVGVFATHTNVVSLIHGLIPTVPNYSGKSIVTYLYFAVGIIGSSMMPYEVYFYSSGAIEEKWSPKSLFDNKLTSVVGMSLGATLSASLLILGNNILKPLHITPELHGTAVLLAAIPFGKVGYFIALIGIIFTIFGAAIETCLAGAYTISQYFKWNWGVAKNPLETPKFTLMWVLGIIIALLILIATNNPVDLVEYAVIFSVLALPFTYFAILKASSDKKVMGKYRSGSFGRTLGWIYLVLISIVALAAIPLMILSNMGKG